jgi:hypothetical protein
MSAEYNFRSEYRCFLIAATGPQTRDSLSPVLILQRAGGRSFRAKRLPQSPHVPRCAGAGIGLRAVSELAVETRGNRPTIEEAQLSPSGGKRRIGNGRRAGNGEKRARQRLKEGIEYRRGHPVMRPGGAGVQRQMR